MNLRKVLHITNALAVVGLVLMLLGALMENFLLMALGVLAVAVCVAFSVAKWRCPHCGKKLGRDTPKYCPHCGEKLDDLQ